MQISKQNPKGVRASKQGDLRQSARNDLEGQPYLAIGF